MKWDKGVDYTTTYQRILNNIKRSKGKSKCYLAIALVQLRNGARVSEAVRGFKEFLKTGKDEVEVRVSKKKHDDYRAIIIPQEIQELKQECADLIDMSDYSIREGVRQTLRNKLKINTHSLRYSFITYLSVNGVSPNIIAKITHHSKLDMILNYTQEKVAKETLNKI